MPIPELPKKSMIKVRWIQPINAHKVGDIEPVGTGRVKGLLANGWISLDLAPPKPERLKVERAVAPKAEEKAVAPPEEKPEPPAVPEEDPEPKPRKRK